MIDTQFYDFEVTKYDWLVVCIDPSAGSTEVIVNDKEHLRQYYEAHKDEIWVGYNSRNYDQYILKGILLGFNPKKISDFIIEEGNKGWEYSSTFNEIQLYNYDCSNKFNSLKQLEGFMGNSVEETEVPFNIDRKLTQEEIDSMIKYCTHDVEQTMEVFLRTKATFDAHIAMLKTFDLGLKNISKTQAQLSALALGCVRQDHFDEWDLQFVDTLRIKKYADVIEWFKASAELPYDRKTKYQQSLTVNVCGIPHQFGWGGLHGAPDHPIHRKGLILHVDVTSYYPSLMIRYDLLSRNVKDKSVYKKIYDTRVKLKAEGKKVEQAPYKIILNSTYGICKDPSSSAYDPRQANNVCVNGQLLLLDLLEHLEKVEGFELIQSNTDGLIIQIPDTDEAFDRVDDVCWEWEQRTGMSLGFDVITEIFQKDVNNYVFRFENGKIERKGAYVKPLSDLDNDLPIVNKALVDYIVDGIPVKQTIMQATKLKDFQKIVKVSSKYICAYHNCDYRWNKTFRVFASKRKQDTFIGKVKNRDGCEVIEKFANTPENCFIENGDINDAPVPEKLDRQYYIDLANKRLEQFGVS